MMKKLFSLTLAMVTALGLMLPASAAEETTDEALAMGDPGRKGGPGSGHGCL